MPLKRRPFNRPKPVKLVDLCRINTDAFRHMTAPQLERAEQSVGTILDFTEKERLKGIALRTGGLTRAKTLPARRSGVVNYLLSSFISELRNIHRPATKLRPDQEEAMKAEWRQRYGREMPTDEQVHQGYIREAERNERLIWDLQARVGCAIKGDEQVARDAEREGNKPAVARIRKKPLIR